VRLSAGRYKEVYCTARFRDISWGFTEIKVSRIAYCFGTIVVHEFSIPGIACQLVFRNIPLSVNNKRIKETDTKKPQSSSGITKSL